MPPKFKFTEGEKVLCFHGPLIYEAKALRSQVFKDKQVKYFIHYAGWNKNWDEWVPENRVLKYNEANVQKQKEVSKLHASGSAKNKKGAVGTTANLIPLGATPKAKKSDGASSSGKDSDSRASTPSKELLKEPTTSSSTSTTPMPTSTPTPTTATTTPATASSAASTPAATAGSVRGRANKPATSTPNQTSSTSTEVKDEATKKKRGRLETSAVETEEQFIAKVEIKIKIPDDLKPCLVDDWDAINRQQKLLEIPAKTTVQDIINAYIFHKKNSKTLNQNKEVAITDVTTSLIEYFDVMLGCQLLYKFERPQYAEILEQYPDKPMSSIYGAFHLLRLFVRLGSMLGFTSLDEKSVQLLMVHLQDFLKYLVKNSSTLFSIQQFVNVTSEYHRKVQ